MKNGTSEWVKLKDLKESHPVDVAKYARDGDWLMYPLLHGGFLGH